MLSGENSLLGLLPRPKPTLKRSAFQTSHPRLRIGEKPPVPATLSTTNSFEGGFSIVPLHNIFPGWVKVPFCRFTTYASECKGHE